MKKQLLIDTTGWIGVVLIVWAYMAIVFEWLAPNDWVYLAANGVGSACIVISSWTKKDAQPVVLNLVWLLIAVIGLLQYG